MKKIDILRQSIKEEIQDVLKEEYKPYKGGGGPTIEQAEENTRYLGEILKKLKIPFTENMSYIKDMTGEEELSLEFTNPKTGEIDHVSYDRWGYVADGEEVLDQADLKTTITYIAKLFGKKIKTPIAEDAFELTGSTGKKTLATFKNPSDANQFKTQNPNIKQVTKLEENDIQNEALKIIRDTLFNYITELKEIKYGNVIPLATDILNNLNEKDYFITKSNNISEAKDEELQEGDIVFFDGKKVKLVEIRGDKYFIKSISNPGRPAEWVRKSDLSKTSLKSLKPTNEAKDEDEPEIKDDWNKEDKEDTSTDDETIDKTATKGAKKSKSKAEKLDFVIKNLKQCETDIKELINKWKLAKTDEEKQPLISQLKEKNKLKKELEELQDLYSDTLVKEEKEEEYLFNFIGGGWNSVYASDIEEAKKKAQSKYNDEKTKVDLNSFRISTPDDYNNLMSNFH